MRRSTSATQKTRRPVTARMFSYPDKAVRWEFEDMSMYTDFAEQVILDGAADIRNIYQFKKGDK